jgi:hypothetical protein
MEAKAMIQIKLNFPPNGSPEWKELATILEGSKRPGQGPGRCATWILAEIDLVGRWVTEPADRAEARQMLLDCSMEDWVLIHRQIEEHVHRRRLELIGDKLTAGLDCHSTG